MLTSERMVELLREAKLTCLHEMYTDAEGLAHLLSMSPRTLRDWRSRGIGPAWCETNRVLYDLEGVAEWLANGGSRNHRQQAAEIGSKGQEHTAPDGSERWSSRRVRGNIGST